MKLTISQLRQIITEELNEVYIDKQGLPGSWAAKLDKYGTAALLGSMGVLAATGVGAPVAAAGAGAGLGVRKALNWLYDKHQLKSLEDDVDEQAFVSLVQEIISELEESGEHSSKEMEQIIQDDLNSRVRGWQTDRMRNPDLPDDIIHMLRFEEHLIDAADGSSEAKKMVKQALGNAKLLGNETKLKQVGRGISKATSPTEWVKMIKDAMAKKTPAEEEEESPPSVALPDEMPPVTLPEDMPTVADWDPDDAPTEVDWDPEEAPTMVAESTLDRIIMEEIGRAVRLG